MTTKDIKLIAESLIAQSNNALGSLTEMSRSRTPTIVPSHEDRVHAAAQAHGFERDHDLEGYMYDTSPTDEKWLAFSHPRGHYIIATMPGGEVGGEKGEVVMYSPCNNCGLTDGSGEWLDQTISDAQIRNLKRCKRNGNHDEGCHSSRDLGDITKVIQKHPDTYGWAASSPKTYGAPIPGVHD